MVFSGASAEAPPVGDDERPRGRAAIVALSAPWHYRAVRTPVVDALRPFVWLGARLYFRIRFEGVHHIPRSGPLLIVPNHVTYADPVLATHPGPPARPLHGVERPVPRSRASPG